VSGKGTVLNVTDGGTRLTYQYHLPVTRNSTPFNTLGPTTMDKQGYGFPISGGFNKTESALALSDKYGWIDVGEVSANTWKRQPNGLCPCGGAAFTPSDK
jgi:hypothetical protein